MVHRPWRTVTVAGFAVLLILQGYYSFATKPEPYPTIRMPNFGLAATKSGTFDITLAQADAVGKDGRVTPVPLSELMADFWFSTARPCYDYLFLSSNPSKVTPAVQGWLRQRLDDIGVAGRPVELRMCWRRTAISVYDASIVRESPCVWKVVRL